MSGVKAVRFLLANNDDLVAAVPAARIMAGAIPLKTPMPAISVSQVSSVPYKTVSQNSEKRFITERVQVTVQCRSYPQQKALLRLVNRALPASAADGLADGVCYDSIIPDGEGPDFYNAALDINMQSVDFIVNWID